MNSLAESSIRVKQKEK
jgi:hypothetical protein